MASLKLLVPLLILSLSLLSTAAQQPLPPPQPQSLVDAVEALAKSGHTAMSLTLQVIAPTLPIPSAATPLTIFAPPDIAFSYYGQPSLSHLLLHFSPLSLSPTPLPLSSTIPSLSPSKHLTITSNGAGKISIDNVGVSEIPIFDDGYVRVYAIDDFFSEDDEMSMANGAEITLPNMCENERLVIALPQSSEESTEEIRARMLRSRAAGNSRFDC